MKGTLKYLAGIAGENGYGSNSTAEQVTQGSSSPPLTAVITGATSGIGLETARVMAKRGVRIVVPARDTEKAGRVRDSILRDAPSADIIIMEVDLSSFASVTRFCSHFLSLGYPLNILINNAGVFSQKLEFSEDKIEITFATNYLGIDCPFLLTELLLEKMIQTADQSGVPGRIVNVSSILHAWVKRDAFDFAQMLDPTNYNGTRAYAQSKLAAILHAKQLAKQLKERNAKVSVNAVHPGIVKTGIMRAHKGFITDSLYFVASKLLKTPSQGAATTCYVAMRPEVQGLTGAYFADCNQRRCSPFASDLHQAHSLWLHTRALLMSRYKDA